MENQPISKADKLNAYRVKWRASARLLGLTYGGIHPETGHIWDGSHFRTPKSFARHRLGSLLGNIKTRCKKIGRVCELTVADIEALWPADNRCTVFPHIAFIWGNWNSGESPSVDRIDSSKGYTLANCRIISWRANRLKSNATPEESELLAADARRIRLAS